MTMGGGRAAYLACTRSFLAPAICITQKAYFQRAIDHALKARFNSAEATGVNATIQDGTLTTHEGTAPNPDLTIKASDKNFLRVVEGELNFKEAIQQGLIEVKGPGETLLQMARLFTPPTP